MVIIIQSFEVGKARGRDSTVVAWSSSQFRKVFHHHRPLFRRRDKTTTNNLKWYMSTRSTHNIASDNK